MAGRREDKVAGGVARAAALTKDQRKEIAKKAAEARWGKALPRATHEGDVKIGDIEIPAAVLPNGVRVLSQGRFLLALGRSRTPKAGTGALTAVDELPFFLSAEALKPFIINILPESTKPIFYLTKSGKRAVGYDANLLPDVVNVYLDFRNSSLAEGKGVPVRYAHIIAACDALSRGLQRVGIIGLIDEATGFQETRDKRALEEILDRFLRKEFAAWAKRFPDEFYKQIFRLRGWEWKGMNINRPQIVAKYTNDIVYARLAPGIIEELQIRNPVNYSGRRKAAHHQWLTEDIGHPALAQHLYAVIGLMRISRTWNDFIGKINVAFPRRGDNLSFEFMAGFND